MRGKKALVGDFWGNSGLAAATLSMRWGGRANLLILAYHRVLDIPDEDAFPGDPELVSASTEDFERQMRFVRAHFTPLRFSDVLQAMDRGVALPRNSLIVTFDDGHIDNYTNAFPILKSLGVPATIFLSTQYIDAPETPFWFDHIAQLIYFAPAGPLGLDQLKFHASLTGIASRREATGQLLRKLKREPNECRIAVVQELLRRFGTHVPESQRTQRAAMTWDEVREMAAAGIEFGSHTVSHPVLARLDDEAIQQELADSRQAIRVQTGQSVETVAYPVGKVDAFDDRVVATAKSCGYRLGLSYETGVNPWRGADLFTLRRLAIERYVSFGHFKALLSMPGIFA